MSYLTCYFIIILEWYSQCCNFRRGDGGRNREGGISRCPHPILIPVYKPAQAHPYSSYSTYSYQERASIDKSKGLHWSTTKLHNLVFNYCSLQFNRQQTDRLAHPSNALLWPTKSWGTNLNIRGPPNVLTFSSSLHLLHLCTCTCILKTNWWS